MRAVILVRVRQPPLLSQGRIGGYDLADRLVNNTLWEEVSSPDIAVLKHTTDMGGFAVEEDVMSAILSSQGKSIKIYHKGIGQGFSQGVGQCLYWIL